MKSRFFSALPATATLAFAGLLNFSALPVQAQQSLIAAQSEISFTTRQMGVPVEGRFQKFDAALDFDPKKPESAKARITIELGSVDIGDAQTRAELAKPDWFNLGAFPQAKFESSSVKALGAGKFEVAGKLDIKGASQSLVVPVSLSQAAGLSTATGSFIIKRLDFKIGDGDWKDTSMVADPVHVKFKLVLKGVAAQ